MECIITSYFVDASLRAGANSHEGEKASLRAGANSHEGEKVQQAAQNDMETLAKQGGAGGRVRRKTRARGEAGGFLAEREKANNIANRLADIQSKVVCWSASERVGGMGCWWRQCRAG